MKLDDSNRVVNSLWIGEELSFLELLTLKSFVANGHVFHLWTYNPLKTELPKGVVLCNAESILPRSSVFKYPNNGTIDWGSGSYAGFSDIFRYKLLYDKGGWWVDMDVTCLKPLNFDVPYFFRNHWKFPVVGNIMKVPKGSLVMKECFDIALVEVTESNPEWHRPIEILNEAIERNDLLKYRQLGLFNLDMFHNIECYLSGDYPIPADWYGIHWINSSKKITFRKSCTLAKLLIKHNVEDNGKGKQSHYSRALDWLRTFST